MEKDIDKEKEKLEFLKTNLTQGVHNYTVLSNYGGHEQSQGWLDGQPEWVVNLTSLGYGNISQPAIIDPYFPYFQLNPIQFNTHFK